MHYDYTAIPDADVPQAVAPIFQHVVTTYASEANKTASVWRAVPDDLLDFKPHEKVNSIRTILAHQLLSERRFFAQFVGTEELPDVPMPAKGKMFLRNLLGSAGLEMSLNVVPPGRRCRSSTSTDRTTRFTSWSVAGASSSWTASASTWRKAQYCASARQPHGPGGTTEMCPCTSSASSTGRIV